MAALESAFDDSSTGAPPDIESGEQRVLTTSGHLIQDAASLFPAMSECSAGGVGPDKQQILEQSGTLPRLQIEAIIENLDYFSRGDGVIDRSDLDFWDRYYGDGGVNPNACAQALLAGLRKELGFEHGVDSDEYKSFTELSAAAASKSFTKLSADAGSDGMSEPYLVILDPDTIVSGEELLALQEGNTAQETLPVRVAAAEASPEVAAAEASSAVAAVEASPAVAAVEASPAGMPRVALPQVWAEASPDSALVAAVASEPPGRFDPQLNLWQNPYTGENSYVVISDAMPHLKDYDDDGGPNDPWAPQIASMFGPEHTRFQMNGQTADFPEVTRLLRFYDPSKSEEEGRRVQTESVVSGLGLSANPGETVFLPRSGYKLDNGNHALQARVYYIDRERGEIMVGYHNGEIGDGYNFYVKGIDVDERLTEGALVNVDNQPLGRARGEEILISMRDRHTFFDIRFIHHWWHTLTRHP